MGALCCAIAILSCNRANPGSVEAERAGFVISTFGENAPDSRFLVSVYTTAILPAIPEVTINGRTADSSRSSPFTWYFSGFDEHDTLAYRIRYAGDVIEGREIVPGRIDSLFCNGIYLAKGPNAIGLTAMPMAIETASVYLFSWKSDIGYTMFAASYSGDDFAYDASNVLLRDPALVVIPDRHTDRHSRNVSMTFAVSAYVGSDYAPGSGPERTSATMYVYHEIRGPEYRVRYVFLD